MVSRALLSFVLWFLPDCHSVLWQWMQSAAAGIFDLLDISEDGEHLQLNKMLVQHLEVR